MRSCFFRCDLILLKHAWGITSDLFKLSLYRVDRVHDVSKVWLLVLGLGLCLDLHATNAWAMAVQSPSAEESSESETLFDVGVATVDVTPTTPIRLNGFGGRREEATEVGERIVASAIAISQGAEPPVVWVTLDSLGIRTSMVDEVARRVAQSHQLPRQNLAITFTHSHCTPKVDGACDTIFSTPIPADHQAHITAYTTKLTDDLTEVVRRAIDAREPSSLAWGIGNVGFAANRRTPGGPVDHSLPVLVVLDASGDLRAIHTSYACHCVTLSYNKINGDWAGYARIAIERRWPGVTGMVSIGCGSDSNPDSGVTGDGVAIAASQGDQIADEIERMLEAGLSPISQAPVAVMQTLPLPLANLPTTDQLQQLATQQDPTGYNARWQLEQLASGKPLTQQLDYVIQSFRFGDELAMVMLAGEVCADYSLRLKRELNVQKLWTIGYANDFCAYIPSERLLKEGGYGGGAETVYFALPAMLAEGLEQKIVDQVRSQLPESWQVPDGTDGVPASDVESSRQSFRIDDRFEIQAAAAEPQVADPVAIDFDVDRSIWVCEMTDYARPVEGEFEPAGRVRHLFDDDGDGVYERSVEFLGGLRFPTDVKVWRDGVLICDAPRVLIARDTDGDGRADSVRTLLDGFATHNPHARVNSLRWGLDGWLYGSCGLFGGSITIRRDDEANDVVEEAYPLGGRDFRWRPDTGEFEAVSGSTQQGRSRDDWNRWYGCDNGTLIRHYPLEPGAAERAPWLDAPSSAYDPTAVDAPGVLYPAGPLVMFALSGAPGRPTSACGLEIHRDGDWGADFEENSFTCEPVNQLVHRRVLREVSERIEGRRAAGEQASEFLTSTDRWFRPVQVRSGPDGGLWVVDMVRYVIEHPQWIPEETRARTNLFAGQGLGRLWRIAPRDANRTQQESELAEQAFYSGSDQGLLLALASQRGALRDLAHQQMIWNQRVDLIDSIREIAIRGDHAAARLQAWYLLSQLTVLTSDDWLAALADEDPRVREQVARLVAESCDVSGEWSAFEAWANTAAENDVDWSAAEWALSAAVGGELQMDRVIELLKWNQDPYSRYQILSRVRSEQLEAWRERVLLRVAVGSAVLPRDLAQAIYGPIDPSAQAWLAAFEQTISLLNDEVHRANGAEQALFVLDRTRPTEVTAEQLDPQVRQLLAAQLERDLETLDQGQTNATAAAMRVLNAEWIFADSSQKLMERIAPQSAQATQAAAVEALSRSGLDQQRELFDRLVEASPALQTLAVERWLENDSTRESWLVILESQPDAAAWMSATLRDRLLEGKSETEIAALLERWQVPADPDQTEVLKRYLQVAQTAGSVSAGAEVFTKHCAACHLTGSTGGRLGPDLAALSGPTVESLAVSILQPSRDIDAKYRSVAIETLEGRTVVGLLLEEGQTAVRVQLSATESESIPRSEIAVLAPRRISFMPERLDRTISAEELRDVVLFLRSRREPAKQLAGNQPRAIAVSSTEETNLPAEAAEIRGGDIAFESPFGNVGYWHSANDSVSWLIDVPTSGRFEVILDYACDDSAAGNRISARLEMELGSVAGSQIEGDVVGTGAWSNYQDWSLGEMELPTGRVRLEFKGIEPQSGPLCDLRAVRLRPLVQ